MAYYKVTQKQSGGSATLITKNITANGTYNASSDNADGYSSVTVNTPSIPSGTHVDPWNIKSANQLNIKYQNSYYDIVNGALTDVIEFYVNTTSGYEGMSILIPNKYGLESGKTYTMTFSLNVPTTTVINSTVYVYGIKHSNTDVATPVGSNTFNIQPDVDFDPTSVGTQTVSITFTASSSNYIYFMFARVKNNSEMWTITDISFTEVTT